MYSNITFVVGIPSTEISGKKFRNQELSHCICKQVLNRQESETTSSLTFCINNASTSSAIYRVFHNCWNKAIGHKSRILN